MGKGYAEGPAAEAAEEARERLASGGEQAAAAPLRRAVFGCTPEREGRSFLGWADEVDADQLFASGRAWGIQLARIQDDGSHSR